MPKEKNRTLLDILKTRGPHAFDAFVNALRETEQHDLANLLVPTPTPNALGVVQPTGLGSGAAGGVNPTPNPQLNVAMNAHVHHQPG